MSTINRAMTDSPLWWALLGKQKGRLLFDVGANVGQAAAHMGRNFDIVVSFEPCKESYRVLAAECAPNVVPVCEAVSNTDGFILLSESSNSIRDGSLTTGSGKLCWGVNVGMRGVPACTLNSAAEEYGTPDVVKVDVEGHEIQVLEGATELFGYSNFFIEVHDARFEDQIVDLLAGYVIERYENVLEGFEDCADTFYLAATL